MSQKNSKSSNRSSKRSSNRSSKRFIINNSTSRNLDSLMTDLRKTLEITKHYMDKHFEKNILVQIKLNLNMKVVEKIYLIIAY